MYKDISDDDMIPDLLKRKEFYTLAIDRHEQKNQQQMKRFEFANYQLFMANFGDPSTGYGRQLIKHGTGLGKTITSLAVAFRMVNEYVSMNKYGQETGLIYVIGFNKKGFQRELLRHPEFGYVTPDELREYNRLKGLSHMSNDNQEKFQEFDAVLKKRLANPKKRGYYRFVGYQELVNQLFQGDIEGLSEDEILAKIESKEIRINQKLLANFKKSFVICDEIHNVYNSKQKNTYGIALRYLFDSIPELRATLLSATPLNMSPLEVIPLLQLLIPNLKLKVEDLFESAATPTLTKDGRVLLAKLFRGRVSFLQDTDPKYFPLRVFDGEKIVVDGKELPYLKFERNEMPPKQYEYYSKAIGEDGSTGKIPLEYHYLNDLMYPIPDTKVVEDEEEPKRGKSDLLTLRKIRNAVQTALDTWKNDNKVEIRNGQVSGDWLMLENIGAYSGKLRDMVDKLITLNGKALIYHPAVQGNGILFLAELLQKNGFIEYNSSPTENTLCSKCRKPMGTGAEISAVHHDHPFLPATYVLIYGEIDKSAIERAVDRYNAYENRFGHNIQVILGSQVLEEKYDIKAIQHVFVTTVPSSISTLLQIIGRGIRKGSHADLEEKDRIVHVHLLVSSIPGKKELSYEERRYQSKLAKYLVIQDIEDIINKSAMDSSIHRETLMKSLSKTADLGNLYFEPPVMPNLKPEELNRVTFTAYYAEAEVEDIIVIIKRLFLINPVWTLESLWAAVRDPPFKVERKTEYYDRESFVCAMNRLVLELQGGHSTTEDLSTKEDWVTRIFNPMDKVVVKESGEEYRIVQLADYYIMFPVVDGKLKMEIEAFNRPKGNFKHFSADLRQLKGEHISYNQMKYNLLQKYSAVITRYNLSLDSSDNVELNDKLYLDLLNTLNSFEESFHLQFVEDAISYAFNLLTGATDELSEFHELYFVVLYFYAKMDLIIFANVLDSELYADYLEKDGSMKPEKRKSASTTMRIKAKVFMISSVERGRKLNLSSLNRFIKKPKKTVIRRVPGEILPVGHYMTDEIRLYTPAKKWFNASHLFTKKSKDTAPENPLIIGYYEKNRGIDIKFKMRSPVQKITKHQDARLIERGMMCINKKKEELIALAKKLGIKVSEENVHRICEEIRNELVRRELAERKKPKNKRVKWFYFYFE
nr:putative ATP-dependent RNA helicase [Kaumoebavirus]